jgi:site-specific recombinase
MRKSIEHVLASADGVELLARLVSCIRPSRGGRDDAAKLREMSRLLSDEPELASRLRRRTRDALRSLRLVHVLVDSGILSSRDFFAEVMDRVGDRFLPCVYPPEDVRSILAAVFPKRNDWKWVGSIATEDWTALFDHFVEEDDARGIPHEDVAAAILALAQRIGSAGIDEEVSRKLSHVEDADSPFLSLSATARGFLADHREGVGSVETFERALAHAQTCRDIVLHLRDNKQTYGTSLRLTRMTRRLLQQLQRLELLVRLVHPRDSHDLARSLAPLLQALVEGEQAGHRVGRLVGQSIDLVAYQITEHTARKGEKYVAHTPRAYWGFLVASIGGGALVAVFAVVKLFLSKLSLPLAAQALVYGANYAVCFVLIYLTGAILATKLPAVTASAIAQRLDRASSRSAAIDAVADTVVVVWRSQFVSFLGNLVCAFPFAILIGYALEHVLLIETASPEKVKALLDANHPWRSGSLFYAAIAGVCLFAGGVIHGAVENHIIHSNVRARLDHHPQLQFLGSLRTPCVSFVTRHLSGTVSNAALGFMLGSAGVIGVIVGLPIDIRHIAFSSAHAGVAVLDAPGLVDNRTIVTVLCGILGIGTVNFVVSFGLTLAVTLKSRRSSFGRGSELLIALVGRIIMRLPHWFLPIGNYDHVADDAPE